MKSLTTLAFSAALLAISLTGIANAQGTPQKMTMGDMPMMQGGSPMQSDPAEMCSSMMESLMKDPAIHRRMNEIMHHGMGMGMGMSTMQSDPAETCSSMMETMMKDPSMHRRMNTIMNKRMPAASPTASPSAPMGDM